LEGNVAFHSGACLDSDGARHGWWVQVASDGSLVQAAEWRKGSQDGLVIGFDEFMTGDFSGVPGEIARIHGGKLDGTFQLFIDGHLRVLGEYENGERVGCWREWFGPERPYTRGAFTRSVREGLWETWFEDGRPRARGLFRKGRLEQLERHADGHWTSATAPTFESCERFSRSIDHPDEEAFRDVRDSCLLNMTEPEIACLINATNLADRRRCLQTSERP
jgi:hypothetical protein